MGLADRLQGGPLEQIRSIPFRLRSTRACDIVHSSLEDPLSSYKTLEPMHPRLKYAQRRYHLTDGYKCFDQDTIIVSARDRLTKTQNGLLRTSTGTTTYSDTHRKKFELDVQELTRIVALEGVPGGGHAWTPKKLERIFKERTGRVGVWSHYEFPFVEFLRLFPRTFDVFNQGAFVKLWNARKPVVMDRGEDALVRMAKARETGFVEQATPIDGGQRKDADGQIINQPVAQPELMRHRLKTTYRPYDDNTMQDTDDWSAPEGFQQQPQQWQQSVDDDAYAVDRTWCV